MNLNPQDIPVTTHDQYCARGITFGQCDPRLDNGPVRADCIYQFSDCLWLASVVDKSRHRVAEVHGSTEADCRTNAALLVNAVNQYRPLVDEKARRDAELSYQQSLRAEARRAAKPKISSHKKP